MKKFFMLLCSILLLHIANAQIATIGSENFNGGSHTFTSTPGTAWYHWVDASVGSSKVIYGGVPNMIGDSIVLTSPVYDFSSYNFVQLRFDHICKVSPSDEVRVEYRLDLVGAQGAWKPLPGASYMGSAINFALNGFNASSYSIWQANDSLAMPNASWWRGEIFDMSDQVALDRAQFRFVIKKGTAVGSNVSYGWIIDNFQVLASNTAMRNPVVEIISGPFDTVYATGPYTIKAKVATRTSAPIVAPYMVYSTSLNNTTHTDSVLMTAYQGDSLWQADLPQVVKNTAVAYSITGRDTAGNNASVTSGYVVSRFAGGGFAGMHYVGDTTSTLTESYIPYYTTYNYGWSRVIYTADELPTGGGTITDIAFYPSTYSRTTAMLNQSLYMKAVNDTVFNTAAYVDPTTDGATLVWSGSIPANLPVTQPLNLTLNKSFILPAGKNLMIYWINGDGSWTGSATWKYTSTGSSYKSMYSYSDDGITAGSISRVYTRPVTRLYVIGEGYSDSSVALVSIDNPTQATVQGNTTNQVQITVKNLGAYDIDNLQVNWSVNGVLQTPYQWTGGSNPIPWDFERQLTIGSFVPSVNAYDTLCVWVAMANDTVTKDDTLSVILYGCAAPLAGTYVIGPGNRFTTLDEAIGISNLCGASADVEFVLPSGDTYTTMTIDTTLDDTTYTTHYVYEGKLSIDSLGFNYGPYTCTITSAAHNADSVVFYATGSNILNNVRNVIIKDITFRHKNNLLFNTITLTGINKNITIRDCKFEMPYAASSYAAIRKNNTAGDEIDSLFILNNTFRGGYYATYLYGTSAVPCTNITIDSNYVRNTYYYGFYNYYANTTYNYNTLVRDTALSSTNNLWYGIYDYYSKGNITNNRIIQTDYTNTKNVYGIYMYYHNRGGDVNDLVANNEIITHITTNAYYPIYSGYTCADFMFNSIHTVLHAANSAYGLYVVSDKMSNNAVKYNDICVTKAPGIANVNTYPLYLASLATYGYTLDVADNNLYSVNGYVGYAGAAYNDITKWMALLGDNNSTSICPVYADSVNSNMWADYSNASTTILNSRVITDINGDIRTGLTAKGCYNGVTPKAYDAALVTFYMNPDGLYAGNNDSIYVVLLNGGTSALTSANIFWSINGVNQTHKSWTGNLGAGQFDTIFLGRTTYIGGPNEFMAYIELPASITDSVSANDTVTLSTFICDNGGMKGTYTIGKSGADFTTFYEAYKQVKECGMSADVTLSFLPGTYKETFDFTDFGPSYHHGHNLILTSSTGNPDDVTLQYIASPAINFSASENVTINGFTIDVTSGTVYGVYFTGNCNNITISNNKILGNTTSTGSYGLIYKTSSGISTNITVKNNILNGNYYGIYFYGGTSTGYGSILIDSNTITNQYYYGIYSYYSNTVVNANTLKSRSSDNTTYWYAIYSYYNNTARFTNNKVLQMTDGIIYPYGIYTYYANRNDSTSDSALIANNMISLSTTSSYYGIYLGYFNGEVLHNTVMIKSATNGYGIYRTGTTYTDVCRIKNNILYTTGTSSYPIYLSTGFTSGIDDIDANDMKGGTYVGYSGGARSTISNWKGVVLTDFNSVSITPTFLSDECFDLVDSTGFTVPALTATPDDINGVNRGTSTTMGAYHFYVKPNNAYPVEWVNLDAAYAANTTVPLKAVIKNAGSVTLTSLQIHTEINGVAQPVYNWTGSLATDAVDTVTIQNITIAGGVYKLKLYTSMPNNTADLQPDNDTLYQTIVTCNGTLSGTYTIGAGEDYEDLELAFMTAKYCGISGQVTFAINGTQYVNATTFMTVDGTSNSNRIVISSAGSTKANIYAKSSPVINLKDVENLRFENLNISDGNQSVVVKFSGICRNITFDNCNLNGKPSSTSSTDRTVECYNSSSTANGAFNIVFNNNVINGGYYNMYLYYTMGATGSMTKNNGWEITNNTLTNAYYYGIYSYYYGYYRKINNNTVKSRSNSGGYYGLYMYYYNSIEEMQKNRINITATSTAYGIANYYYNNDSYGYTQPALVANNEIIIKSTGSSYVYGYYDYYSKINFYNNSIYCYANYSYGAYLYNSSSSYAINFYNNNIVVNKYSSGTTQYPLYIGSTTYASSTYGLRDYNNYYNMSGSTTVASLAGTATTLTGLKAYQDAHSVSVNPGISNPLSILSQGSNLTTLQCPMQADVPTDITGANRSATTMMGAYADAVKPLDAGLIRIELASKEAGVSSKPVLIVENVGINNINSIAYTVDYNGITSTGTINQALTFLKEYAVELPTFTTDTGVNNITVYITSVNGIGLDSNQTNDTLLLTFTDCSKLHGTYIVGNGTGADFADIAAFKAKIEDCGVDGDIELQYQSGTYAALNVTAAVTDAMEGYKLTISSEAEDSSKVTFTTSGVVLALNGQSNLVIKNVTLYSTGGYTVQITNNISDVTFTHCAIKSNPTTTSSTYACVYKASSTGIAENLVFNNCLIDGGYYGLYLYGVGTNSYNICSIDSCTISNQYYYAMYSYYTHCDFRYNDVLSRTSSATSYWYGKYSYYGNGDVIGNRIKTRSTTISSPYMMYHYYHGYYNNTANKQYLIANNEVDFSSTSSYYGIYFAGSIVSIVNNSVRMTGTGSAYGIYIGDNSYNRINVYNNIVDMNAGHPFYISGTTYLTAIQSDYNNFIGAEFAYAGAAYSSQSSWILATHLDSHSVSVKPVYANTTTLETNNYASFFCPAFPNVTTDITGKSRMNKTIMGAYTPEVKNFDLAISDIEYPNGVNMGVANNVTLNVINLGATPITGANIAWTANGVAQTPYTWTAPVALDAFESASINIGSFIAPNTAGFSNIKVWFTAVNNTTDDVASNDTIEDKRYVCNGPLAGNYSVGSANADYATIEDALAALEACGVDSAVVMNIASGTYNPLNLNFEINGASTANTVTFTSASGNASDVKFVGVSALALGGNIKHVILKNMTFDASATSADAIVMSGQITNVEINGCEILANPSATATSSAAIRYANSSGATSTLTDVRILNNHINGGYYGLYLYYTAGSGGNMLSNNSVRLDGNTIENYYYYGLYSYYYNHYTSISHNTFRSRASSNVCYNMYLYYYNTADTIDGNSIEMRNTSTGYGMYMYYYFGHPSYSKHTPYVVNNEVRQIASAGSAYGMYCYYYNQANFYNNTVALNGTGSKYGFYFYTANSSYYVTAKNNIFYTGATGTGYPLYISSATYATSTYITLDYNDYYSAGSYVGYIGSAQSSLSGLQTLTGQDVHSMNVNPAFADSSINCALSDYTSFLVSNVGNVKTDINGNERANLTAMGAHSPVLHDGKDVELVEIIGFPETGEFCTPNFTDIDIVLNGSGLEATNFAVDTLTVHVGITGAIYADTTFTICNDSLPIFTKKTFNVFSNLNITPAGTYMVEAWIACAADTLHTNDSLSFNYIANKVSLPLDEDFANGLPLTMRVADNNTATGWEVVYDSLNGVIPATGNAMIAFDGTRGAMTRVFTRQLDFTGTSQPVLDFWYYHDTAATAGNNDYTDVRLTFDGGETFTTLFSVRKNNGTDMGWTQYSYPLDSFVNYNCVILVFEAMRMSLPTFDGAQYIDRIKLTSNQDLAVGAIQTSELSACSYTGKELQVVLSSLTGQAIDFSKYPTTLNVTVSGAATANYNVALNSGLVPALDNDTIVVDNNFDFNPGTYTVKAWVSSIDKVTANDTLTQTLTVNPSLNVDAQQVTGGNDATNCIGVGSQVNQMVTVTNNGNMTMEDLELTMNIYDINGVLMTTYTDTIAGVIAVGDSVVKTFTDAYTVPAEEMYTVEVIANPACNANLTFNKVITECVDQSDIEVAAILAPVNGVAQGSNTKVTVRVANNHPYEDAQGVVLHVIVANADGSEIANWTETMNDITAGEYIDYEFPQSFTVPSADNFTITAFVNNIDTKASNDTLVATIATDVAVNEADANGMSLSQNVPNPANSQAVVSYSIPEDGSVVFTILTVTGQVLHTQTVEALAGNNSIEFNTENLASGVYFYTMDFQGQRLMKKMVIKK